MIDPTTFDEFLPGYLARQPWFAHGEAKARIRDGEAVDVGVTVRRREVWKDANPGLVWAILDTTLDGRRVGSYQVLIGLRPSVPSPGFLIGATSRVLGTFAGDGSEWLAYDALVDPELTAAVLETLFEDLHGVRSVRKLTVGKISTSVVADEAWLCKVFRRVYDGENLGVEMPARLWEHGFRATLETVEAAEHEGMDLALRRPFLPGAANGLALAEASLRELFASGLDPQLSPGDFSAEARRIGRMLADMHTASEAAYGVTTEALDEIMARLRRGILGLEIEGLDAAAVDAWIERSSVGVPSQIPAMRVHGNLHLGQLLRSDRGWLILDFEGAPLMTSERRRRPLPGWFDVGSMIRSFDYVAAMTRAARVDSELDGGTVDAGATMWVERNTAAFLDGYRLGRHIDATVDIEVAAAVGATARAAYEVAYERAHRPEMAPIPIAALRGLILG